MNQTDLSQDRHHQGTKAFWTPAFQIQILIPTLHFNGYSISVCTNWLMQVQKGRIGEFTFQGRRPYMKARQEKKLKD